MQWRGRRGRWEGGGLYTVGREGEGEVSQLKRGKGGRGTGLFLLRVVGNFLGDWVEWEGNGRKIGKGKSTVVR